MTAETLDRLAEAFADAHQRLYGFVAAEEPVQLVTFRVEATGVVNKATLRQEPIAGPDASDAIQAHRDLWIAEQERAVTCPVYDRDRLRPGNCFVGPAIVEQMDATTVVLRGMNAKVDGYLNIIVEVA